MHSFVPPKPKPEAPRVKRSPLASRLTEDTDKRAIRIAIAVTVFFHAAVILLMPDKLDSGMEGQFTPEHMGVANKTFNIELNPEEFASLKVPEKKKVPTNFVETNPDLPDNEPDKTDNFAAQNQQAAQEKPATKTGGDRPEMEGRTDLQSNQVVSGNLSPTTPIVPLPPPPTPQVPTEQEQNSVPVKERTPLPGIEKYVGDNAKAFGSNIAKIAPHPEDIDKKVEGTPDAPTLQGVQGVRAKVSQLVLPRERPKLDKRARPAIFSENKVGTSNIGVGAIDAFRSNYGEYLQKLTETVQMQWEKLISESRAYPAPGSMVHVRFEMNAAGDVTTVLKVESGMAGQQAERNCVSAITLPAPYGKWTDDMVAMLGEKQELSFTFLYQ